MKRAGDQKSASPRTTTAKPASRKGSVVQKPATTRKPSTIQTPQQPNSRRSSIQSTPTPTPTGRSNKSNGTTGLQRRPTTTRPAPSSNNPRFSRIPSPVKSPPPRSGLRSPAGRVSSPASRNTGVRGCASSSSIASVRTSGIAIKTPAANGGSTMGHRSRSDQQLNKRNTVHNLSQLGGGGGLSGSNPNLQRQHRQEAARIRKLQDAGRNVGASKLQEKKKYGSSRTYSFV
eukprot:sb/3469439/